MEIQTGKKYAYLFGILADHELDYDACDAARAAVVKKVAGQTFCDPVLFNFEPGDYKIVVQKVEE